MSWQLAANILFILLMVMGLVVLGIETRREQWKEYAGRMRRERDEWRKRYSELRQRQHFQLPESPHCTNKESSSGAGATPSD